MSIEYECKHGWILCHKTFLNNIYLYCINEKSVSLKLRLKNEFFNIKTPVLMESAAKKIAIAGDPKYKKKKRKKTEEQCSNYHATVKPFIEEAVKALVQCGRDLKLFHSDAILPIDWLENNLAARQAAKGVLSESEASPPILHNYFGDVPLMKTFQNKRYLLPPHSSFLLSDVSFINTLIGNKYDAILIDPPWKNKSVKRKKGYSMIDCEDLLTLPIQELMNKGSLLIVWATNNEKQMKFIKERLFPRWNIEHCADWHWIKVTQGGTFIHPIDSNQKKPYENLILGHFKNQEEDGDETKLGLFRKPEQHKIIVSIPSSIHSHKPPLSEVLKPYLPENANCLELFARYLLPGWTSCGNEVLKLQTITMFEEIQEDQRISH